MPDMSRFHEFMEKFIPMLLQRKFRKEDVQMWLEKALKEIGAREASQLRLGEQRRMTELLNRYFGATAEGVKGQDYPGYAYLERVGGVDIPGLEAPAVPGDYQEKLQAIAELVRQFAIAREAGEFPTEATIKDGTQMFGSKATLGWLDKYFGGEMRKEEIAGAEELRGIERDKLGVRREELKLKKKGKEEKPGKEGTLEKLIKDREKLINKMDIPLEGEEAEVERINRLTKQINALQKEMGLKSDEEYKEVAERLKAKGYTNKNIDRYPEVISMIKKQGFEIWVLKGYL